MIKTRIRRAESRPSAGEYPAIFLCRREILGDLDTPLSCYMKLKNAFPASSSFLLESVEAKERLGRFSFIGFDPFLTFKSRGTRVWLSGVLNEEKEVDDPLCTLRGLMKELTVDGLPVDEGCPGGAVGYVGYDVIRFIERLPDLTRSDLSPYDMWFMFPRKLVIFDNYTRRMRLAIFRHRGQTQLPEREREKAGEELEELYRIIRTPLVPAEPSGPVWVRMKEANLSKEEFESMVLRAKEYIFAGDVIQVVLSQRLSLETNAEDLSLYRALRIVNPSPYMFLLDCGEYSLIGSSPETLVRLEGDEIEVRPIAGTKKRGKNVAEDEKLAEELLNDEKERAEHVMLVDLGRNDVGRIAATGTVKVPEFMAVEKYSHVMHITSSVKGRIAEGLDAFDVFRATFPAGTVSGAPKVRAMEIIEELEHEKRGTYAGCTGYFAYNGNMDFCITIRTLLKIGHKVYIQAGAGIVADSVPETEYRETLQKAKAVVKSIMEIKEIIN
jgi:anthranilate synthase component I